MLLLGFAGCIPTGGSYLRAEHSDATYMQEGCYGTSGPPYITFIPYNGAYLSVLLNQYVLRHEKGYEVVYGVHLPAGHAALLLEKEIVIGLKRVPLVPASHGRRGSSPYLFKSADPFGKEDYFGTLTGDTENVRGMLGGWTAYKWYEFSARISGDMPETGNIVLPALRVDGTDHSPLTLPFLKRSYVEMGPFNC